MKQLIRHILREHTREMREGGKSKITTLDFIDSAKKIHGDRYDYSKVNYVNRTTPVTIICRKHGEFNQKPTFHIQGSNCPKCRGSITTNDEFIEKSKEIHGDKYDYSETKFTKVTEPVTIICRLHGDFTQKQAIYHLQGIGCPKCGKKSTTEEFIENAKKIHGDKYDYSKVKYDLAKKPVIIVCPIHGEFKQTPIMHLRGAGCKKCSGNSRSSTDEFIDAAKKVHGNKYDYSQVNYINNKTKVKIICPIHGEFEQKPNTHLNGSGCYSCGKLQAGEKIKSDSESFIEMARKIHGDKYDYSKVEYKTAKSPVKIICPIHGEFEQIASYHLSGNQCKKCGSRNLPYTTDEYIQAAKEIHGDRYKYDNLIYVNAQTPVKITCKKHGDFLQKPSYHLSGQGCAKCSESRGHTLVRNVLANNGIIFEEEKKFEDCTNEFDGRYCIKLPFDFYLPSKNTIIEYDGVQHYVPSFGEKSFEITKRNDKIKNQYCKKNGIKLIRIPYTMKKEEIEPYILKELGFK